MSAMSHCLGYHILAKAAQRLGRGPYRTQGCSCMLRMRTDDRQIQNPWVSDVKGCTVLQANYSDDWLWFVKYRGSAQELLRVAGAQMRDQ